MTTKNTSNEKSLTNRNTPKKAAIKNTTTQKEIVNTKPKGNIKGNVKIMDLERSKTNPKNEDVKSTLHRKTANTKIKDKTEESVSIAAIQEEIKREMREKEKNEINLNEGLPSGGFIIRKRGDDYEMFPENQIMWRAREDLKLTISTIGTFILIILIIVFFYNLGKYFDFIFGSIICSILFSIVGVWHQYSFNSYKFIQKHIKSGIKVGFIIGMLLYDVLYFIISFATTAH